MALEFKVGRPPTLTSEVHNQLVDAVTKVFKINTVSMLVGLPSTTVRQWLKIGAKDVLEGNKHTIYAQLWIDYSIAKAGKIQQWLEDVQERKKNWQATWELVKAVAKEDYGVEAVEYKELLDMYSKLLENFKQQSERQGVENGNEVDSESY